MRLSDRGDLCPAQRHAEAVPVFGKPQPGAGARKQRRHADRRDGGKLRAGQPDFRLLRLGKLSVQGDAELIAERVHHDERHSASAFLEHGSDNRVEHVGVRQAAWAGPAGSLEASGEQGLDLLRELSVTLAAVIDSIGKRGVDRNVVPDGLLEFALEPIDFA